MFRFARFRVLFLFYALRESHSLLDSSAHFLYRPLVVLVLGWRLAREPASRGFDIIASALNLVNEIFHVGGEATAHEDASVKLLGPANCSALSRQVSTCFRLCVHC